MDTDFNQFIDWSKHKLLRLGLMGLAALSIPVSILPFIRAWFPSAATKITEAPVRVDISALAPGQMMTVLWQGKPVWILRRTPEMIAHINQQNKLLKDPNALSSTQPQNMQNSFRSLNKDLFVVLGKCTHMGCIPMMNLKEGIICPCHGSKFDFAGRVFKGAPASQNLIVPNYHLSADGKTLVIGDIHDV